MVEIGILGAARIAFRAVIAPALRRGDVAVTAVASSRSGAAAEFSSKYGLRSSYDSYEELLADPRIDIVYNALPPAAHAKLSIAALRAGKHVLCEKPFAFDASEALAMVAEAERHDRVLFEAFHDRYHPLRKHVLERVRSLGEILSARAVFQADIPFDPSSIRHDPALGGGAMMDLGCYPVHWLRTLFGSEPKVVAAEAETNPMGADMRMRASLEFRDGIAAEMIADMSGGPMHAHLHIETRGGTIDILNPVLPHLGHSVSECVGGIERTYTIAGGATFDYQLDAMLNAVLQKGEALTGGQDAVANMATIDGIYLAAGFGRNHRDSTQP